MQNFTKTFILLCVVIFGYTDSSFAQCTSASAVYVTPNGSGSGSASSPTSLTNAIAMYQSNHTRTPILMAGGNYTFNNTTLQFPSGIKVEGSFNDNNGVWTKSPTVNTNIALINPPFVYDTIDDYGDTFQVVGMIGILLNNVQNVYLQDFNINVYGTGDYYAYSPTRDGYSIYAIYASSDTNITLLNLV